jgi:tetratricopeptide (TPR) repeat protein
MPEQISTPADNDPVVSPNYPTNALTDPKATTEGETASELPASLLTRVDRYVLGEEIARGGMGVIYRANDTALSREVAVKVLHDKYGPDSGVARRFADEARITAQLQHPAIPPVHDLGTLPDGRPFLAMKFIKGHTLNELLAARPDPSAERSRFVAVFEQVCQAVAYAHAHGVLHRDLKPANVMVGAFGEVQLMDWGLAKVLASRDLPLLELDPEATLAGTQVISLRDSDGSFTQAGSVLGTPSFMPPEQAVGAVSKVDQRSDVFGLGAILAVILTGQSPFASVDAEATRVKAAQGDVAECFARLDTCGAEPELIALCKRCLSPRAAERPAHGGEVAQAVAELRAAADERARRAELERVQAEAEKAAAEERALERRKRRQLWLGAAAALVLAAVGGLTAVLVVQHRANANLSSKNDELAKEQAKAQERFELAQKAIATFHTGVSEDVLLKNDQFKELRTRLLREAAGFYGDLEKLLEGQTDAKSRRLLAEGYYQLGILTRAIGSQAEALAVHRKELAVRRELAAADRDVETRLDLARSLQAVGNLLRVTGDRAAALAAFQEQRDVAAALEAESPTDAIRAMLAQSYHSMALVLSQTAKRADALMFYDKAVALRQALADAHPDNPQFQNDLAASLGNVGQLLAQTPKKAEAMTVYQKAVVLRQKLAEAHPDNPRFQTLLANLYNNIGAFLTSSKPAEALAALEKALAIQQKQANANPTVTEYQANLARSLTNLATVLARTGNPAEVLATYQKALAVRQKLADANPAVLDYRRDLARSHNAIGNLLKEMGKKDDALAAQQKALALRQHLADAHPDVLEFQSELAMSHNTVGVLLEEMEKPAEALASCQKALKLQQKLAAGNSAVNQYQIELARIQENVGMLLEKLARLDEALAAFQKVLEVRQKLADANPTILGYQRNRVDCLCKIGHIQRLTGRAADAAASFRQAIVHLERLPPGNPGHHVNLACMYALLAGVAAEAGSDMSVAEGQAAADKAMAALRRAIAAGYRNIELLRTNNDLDTLRSRADFRKLVKELEAKTR